MIALDTNILVRYFLRDDPEQAAAAKHLLERELTTDNPGFVSLTVIAELIWVLRKVYRRSAEEIGAIVTHMLQAVEIEIESENVLRSALRRSHGDLTDGIIHEIGIQHGCERTVTFDRRFARLPGVELLGR